MRLSDEADSDALPGKDSAEAETKPALLHPLLASVALAALICAVVASLVLAGFFHAVELQGYDLLVLARGSAAPPNNMVVVDFDEASVRAYNAFPIPRVLLAEVVNKISEGSPKSIGLDVILDQPRAEADDLRLAEALEHAGNVILASGYGFGHAPPDTPLPEFQDAAAGIAFGDLPIDEDGAVRRMYLQLRTPDYQALSFPIAIAEYYSDQQLAPGGPGFRILGATRIPLVSSDPDSTLIHFHASRPAQVVTIQDLLNPEFSTALFSGKIVLIGQSSTFGKDIYSTPASRFAPATTGRAMLSGTEIHAAAIATLLSGQTIRILSQGPLWCINFIAVLLLVALVARVRPLLAVALVLAAILVAGGLALLLFEQQIWMKFLSTEAVILLALPAGWGYRFTEERHLKKLAEAERRQLMSVFERYVSPEVAAEIWQRRKEIVLAGEERIATVLFSDIRNFSALTTGKPSAQVLAWLNNYMAAMSEVVKANGGFLNKFIGDGIMVVFGVPLSRGVEEDACRAVQTALAMLQRVEDLNRNLSSGQPQLKIGIGIHTGSLTAGNVGSPDRLEYSVIGDTVNLASRLESLTKEFKTNIVISPQTEEQVKLRFETLALGAAEVRGFPGQIPLHTVRGKIAAEVN